MTRVAVIGGGISGLATAALLGKQGYTVDLFEKHDRLGGRARVLQHDGFTFDMGPSWYHMPEAFDHFFALFGTSPHDFYHLVPLDPQYRAFFTDGSTITITPSLDQTYQLFDSLDPGSADRLKTFLTKAQEQYELSRDLILYRSFLKLTDMISPELIQHGRKFAMITSLESAVAQVTRHPHLQKILLYTILFLGGRPHHTPALFSLMSYLDLAVGVSYPMGGIGSVISAIEQLCLKNNVTIHTGAEVAEIMVSSTTKTDAQPYQATGVRLANGHQHPSDLVVSTADYPFTEMNMLADEFRSYPASYWKKKSMAPSALVIYLGIKGRLPSLTHHSLILEDDWNSFFQEVFEGDAFPTNPSFYLSCITKTDKAMAPPDNENVFITVQTSPETVDTPANRERYTQFLIDRIQQRTGEQFSDRIVFQESFGVTDFTADYHAYRGSAIGLENTIGQSAALRPRMISAKVPNLFYAGQYTHPGVGLPMCLISAELVHELVCKSFPNTGSTENQVQ